MIISASSIIGDKVTNAQGENLGKVEELMIDTTDGEVNYAVISFGGFLGMGEKLFAVPLERMTINTKDKCLILDVPKAKLEAAPGFDKDNWPSSADNTWYKSVHKYYNG